MARTGERREIVAHRLSAEGRAWLDQRALEEDLTIRGGEPNRSEMIRIAVEYAKLHMPKGWRPGAAPTTATNH